MRTLFSSELPADTYSPYAYSPSSQVSRDRAAHMLSSANISDAQISTEVVAQPTVETAEGVI